MATLDHTPAVHAQVVDGRPVADYTPMDEGDARRCGGHRTDNTAGYVVRRTLAEDGDTILRTGGTGGVGVDVYAVACEARWGNYDKALIAARQYRTGRGWAVVDTLFRCGHRAGA